MVHGVVVLESRITDRVLPLVLRKPAVMEGGAGSVEECAVCALHEAVFLWRIWDGWGVAGFVPRVCLHSCSKEVFEGVVGR